MPVLDQLATVGVLADRDPVAATGQVDAALHATTTAIDRLRQITSTVYSRVLTEEGLAAALRAEARMPGVDLTVSGAPRWPAAIESCLFACCGDLLRHASGPVRIELATEDDQAEVRFRGLSSYAGSSADTGWIDSTRERIEVLGGTVCPVEDQLVLRLPLILDPAEVRPGTSRILTRKGVQPVRIEIGLGPRLECAAGAELFAGQRFDVGRDDDHFRRPAAERICRVAASPSMPGSRRSMKTRSTGDRSKASIASSALAAEPTTRYPPTISSRSASADR